MEMVLDPVAVNYLSDRAPWRRNGEIDQPPLAVKSIIQDLIEELRQNRTNDPVVLIVEDDPLDAQLMVFACIELGCWVAWARDGEDALRKLDRSEDIDFSVVLLDLRMPGLGGVETLRLLRRAKPELPVILVTGASPADPRVAEAKRLGCLGPVEKPLHSREMREMLAKQRITK